MNIILDPIFIFVFRWGMMGAAVATVIGQVITAGTGRLVSAPDEDDPPRPAGIFRSMAGSAPGC